MESGFRIAERAPHTRMWRPEHVQTGAAVSIELGIHSFGVLITRALLPSILHSGASDPCKLLCGHARNSYCYLRGYSTP